MRYFNYLLILFLFSSCNKNAKIEYTGGSTDLRKIDFEKTKEIKLTSNWNFYWNHYLVRDSIRLHPISVKIPGTWRGNYFLPNKLPSKGFGTYTLSVLVNSDSKDSLGLMLSSVYSSCEVWINGVLKDKRGQFSKVESDNYCRIDPILVALPRRSKIDIVIPISSYTHRMGGGIIDYPIIGKYQYLEHGFKRQIILESITTVTVLLILFFCLLHFILIRKKKIYLFFVLLCLSAMVRQVVIGVGLLSIYFPEIPFPVIQAFRYIGFYMGIGFGIVYFNALYPQFISKKITNAVFIISLLFTLFVIMAPPIYGTYSTIPFQLFGLVAIGYVVFKIVSQFDKNDMVSIFILLSIVIFLATVVNDVVYTQFHTYTGYLQHIGFLIFALMQLFILMMYYKKQGRQINLLTEEIEFKTKDINYLAIDNVNKKIAKKELVEQLGDLIKGEKNEDIAALKKIVQSQKNELLIEENSRNAFVDVEMINSEFYSKLQKKAPNLSKAEMEICLLIRLNLSTKEIAAKRKTTDSSIKVAKHRIRNKMNVKSTSELEQLLNSL